MVLPAARWVCHAAEELRRSQDQPVSHCVMAANRIPRPYLNEDEAGALTETKRADMNAKCSMWRMTHTSQGTRTHHHSLKPHLFQRNMVGNVQIGRRSLGSESGG
jgi:hypothetical protein